MDLVRPISGPLESTANIESPAILLRFVDISHVNSELDMSKYSGTSVHFFSRISN